MKNKIIIMLVVFVTTISSCVSDENPISQSDITFQFTHSWEGTNVTNADFNDFKYTNENGEIISIERLRYLISRIVFIGSNNSAQFFNGYFLADMANNDNLSFTIPQALQNGTYQVTFIFGFNDNDNLDGVYQDLNSVSWNVPGMLGGGYHYMQFDGKYTSSSSTTPSNFNYHTIRAVDNTDPNNLRFQDTSFIVNLGTVSVVNNTIIEVKMNIAEWFKNPNTWDLNVLNTVLMPNFDAQILMNENGQSVFSLGEVTQQ